MSTKPEARRADHPVDPIFLERWSPRAFTGEEIPRGELDTIFEAARWAPSAYNAQPWRFLYARRNTEAFATFLDLLIEYNQRWAKNAAVLIVAVSAKTFVRPGRGEVVSVRTHSFDTGAAWANLALQATRLGWHAHGMSGFDAERARSVLNVPDDHHVDAAIAIGRHGDKSILPESYHAGEAPSGRRPIGETFFEGGFPGSA
ncbi:nitroreductase family protein [Arenibaculum pallidiluteum]|uniref:nitroreductase family protein n=1 Tax=Arenibaculum pallidiluteum TaxID=2812559 RepID=UPI001A96427E|nr:nitroreductase family protein [Arenibaculum pallidiluteum]